MFTSEIIGVLASLFASVGLPNAEQCGNHELMFGSEDGSCVSIAVNSGCTGYAVEAGESTDEETLNEWANLACEIVKTFNGIQK